MVPRRPHPSPAITHSREFRYESTTYEFWHSPRPTLVYPPSIFHVEITDDIPRAGRIKDLSALPAFVHHDAMRLPTPVLVSSPCGSHHITTPDRKVVAH